MLLKLVLVLFTVIILALGTPLKAAPKKVFETSELQAVKAMINPQFLEGDILIRSKSGKKNKKVRKFNSNNKFRNAVASDENIWPNGIIPYFIDESIADQKDLIEKGMKQIMKYTCVQFREKVEEDKAYLRIFRGKGCYASIGRDVDFPESLLSLGTGCHYIGTVVHELMHVVGYFHEHNRHDRDEYLDINYDNIKPDAVEEFEINDPRDERILTTFDYNSVMLYGPRAFSKDNIEITMSPKLKGFYMIEVFEKPGMTKLDAQSINQLYRCPK